MTTVAQHRSPQDGEPEIHRERGILLDTLAKKDAMAVFIIAEAGVNHNGSRRLAFDLVDAAAAAGADAVKFQTFRARDLVTRTAAMADYQMANTGQAESQYAMLKRLELAHTLHHDLAAHCRRLDIIFLSTAFDFDSLAFLVDEVKVDRLKIPSGEVTNGPFLLAHARSGRPLILSTGMATLDEVKTALGVLAYGLLGEQTPPGGEAFAAAYAADEGRQALLKRVTLLHCTSDYPARPDEINLLAIPTLATTFGLPVGYSDHSEGVFLPPLAVAMGARVIEKHFTLDKDLPGPDHRASLTPGELAEMVAAIRLTERLLGDGRKEPGPFESVNRSAARKSLVAATALRAGERFTADNLAIKRPGTGLSPMRYWEMLGKTARRDYRQNEVID